jgi:hypothetical protein
MHRDVKGVGQDCEQRYIPVNRNKFLKEYELTTRWAEPSSIWFSNLSDDPRRLMAM